MELLLEADDGALVSTLFVLPSCSLICKVISFLLGSMGISAEHLFIVRIRLYGLCAQKAISIL